MEVTVVSYGRQTIRSSRAGLDGPDKRYGVTGGSGTRGLTATLLTDLPLLSMLKTATTLDNYNFRLENCNAPVLFSITGATVVVRSGHASFPLGLPLSQHLRTLNISMVSGVALISVAGGGGGTATRPVTTVDIGGVHFGHCRLINILARVHLMLSTSIDCRALRGNGIIALAGPVRIRHDCRCGRTSIDASSRRNSRFSCGTFGYSVYTIVTIGYPSDSTDFTFSTSAASTNTLLAGPSLPDLQTVPST